MSRSSDSSSDATNFGTPCIASEGTAITTTAQSWDPLEHVSQHSGIASTSSSTSAPVKCSDHYRISDFQSLCLTFPELTPSQLQSVFEQCGNDFQRTIDRVLMTKWCNDVDSKPTVQFRNNNDWSATTGSSISGDYALDASPRSGVAPTLTPGDGMAANCYNANANNGEHCYDWRSDSCTGAANDEFFSADYGNDFYYDQVCRSHSIDSESDALSVCLAVGRVVCSDVNTG